MKKVEVKKLAGAGVLSLGLVVGMAGFAGAARGDIDTTGPRSNNEIRHNSRVDLEVDNRNDLDLRNRTEQSASSGDATVRFNTTGGEAETGSATNESTVDAWIEVDNSGAAGELSAIVDAGSAGSDTASIENTGPLSNNEVEFNSRVDVEVDNRNYVDVRNTVEQSAHSGDATVRFNTTGGDATTGDASNTSTSMFTVSISN